MSGKSHITPFHGVNLSLSVSKVQVLPLVGVASEHSQVVRGVVCRLRQDMIHIVHEKENITLRTMVGRSEIRTPH